MGWNAWKTVRQYGRTVAAGRQTARSILPACTERIVPVQHRGKAVRRHWREASGGRICPSGGGSVTREGTGQTETEIQAIRKRFQHRDRVASETPAKGTEGKNMPPHPGSVTRGGAGQTKAGNQAIRERATTDRCSPARRAGSHPGLRPLPPPGPEDPAAHPGP